MTQRQVTTFREEPPVHSRARPKPSLNNGAGRMFRDIRCSPPLYDAVRYLLEEWISVRIHITLAYYF